MTDVLGVCLAWTDEHCVVEPRNGPPVRIRVTDIVSGKPVPAKPSVRLRTTPVEAEAHTAGLFPNVQTTSIGTWTLRWQEPAPAGRRRKRANSCLAMSDPGLPVPEALDAVRREYAARGLPPLVQVVTGSELAAEITASDWVPVAGGDAEFLLTSAAMLRRELRGAGSSSVAVELDGDAHRAHLTLTSGGAPVARARAAFDRDWLGVHDVVVEEAHRRQGWGRRLMAEVLDWGAELGARTVWVHVASDNPGARTFYEGLGFTPHHRCRYLTPR